MTRWKRIGLSIALSLAVNAVFWLAYGHVVRKDAQKPEPSVITWEHLKGEKIGFYTPDSSAPARLGSLPNNGEAKRIKVSIAPLFNATPLLGQGAVATRGDESFASASERSALSAKEGGSHEQE